MPPLDEPDKSSELMAVEDNVKKCDGQTCVIYTDMNLAFPASNGGSALAEKPGIKLCHAACKPLEQAAVDVVNRDNMVPPIR